MTGQTDPLLPPSEIDAGDSALIDASDRRSDHPYLPLEVDTSDPAVIVPDSDRPRMPEPLPVRLMAVADVRLPATVGLERDLDAFYVGLLGFKREGALQTPVRLADRLPSSNPPPQQAELQTMPPVGLGLRNREEPPPHLRPVPDLTAATDDHWIGPVYLAENFKLSFDLVEGLVERDTYRPTIIEVPSLEVTEAKLVEREMEYVRQRGLEPGRESLVLLDPAGNQVELVEMKIVG